MTSVDKVKSICKERKIPISRLEKDLGYANGYIGQLRKGTFPDVRLTEIAAYFGVTTDYLLGKGPQNDPLHFCNQIFSVMTEQRLTLDALSVKAGLTVDTIRTFAFGRTVDNGRDCLEKLAKALNVSESYLMGWTGVKEDCAPYLDITDKAWEYANNDPQKAYDLHQAAELNNDDHSNKKASTQTDGRENITFDDFTYAMQNETKDLTDADKQLLLSMARQLNDARKHKNGEHK